MPSVEVLIELLRKISKSVDHVHVDVDYDGKTFEWKLPQKNLTPSEWIPRQLKTKNDR